MRKLINDKNRLSRYFQSVYTIWKMFEGNRKENIADEYATFNKNHTPKDIFIHSEWTCICYGLMADMHAHQKL